MPQSPCLPPALPTARSRSPFRCYRYSGLAGSPVAQGLVYRVRHLQWDTDLAVKVPRLDWELASGA